MAGRTDLKDRAIECLLVGLRRLAHSRDLADELQRCAAHFIACGRGLASSQYLDTSAHPLQPRTFYLTGDRRCRIACPTRRSSLNFSGAIPVPVASAETTRKGSACDRR